METSTPKTPSVRNCPKGYEALASVLMDALCQAAYGKGNERHATNNAFENQPIIQTPMAQRSPDGLTYQVSKKAIESGRLPGKHGDAELLGAIVYSAAAILVREKLRG